MPLETATYISQLVPANPASDDALATAQTHLQLIKSVLQAQFPNLGAAPATAAAAELYAGIGSAATNALSTTKTGTQSLQSSINMALGTTFNAASVMENGVPLIPRGVIMMWVGSVASIPPGWVLCNGANGTPVLTDRFIVGAGNSYAVQAVGGAAAQTVSTSAAGSHNHGGADAVAGPFAMSGSADAQGYHNHTGATAGAALSVDNLPPHSHGYGVSAIGVAGGGTAIGVSGSSTTYQTNDTGSGTPHAHGIYADGTHTHNIAVSNSPAHQHGIATDGNHAHTVSVATTPPYVALCYIMKT